MKKSVFAVMLGAVLINMAGCPSCFGPMPPLPEGFNRDGGTGGDQGIFPTANLKTIQYVPLQRETGKFGFAMKAPQGTKMVKLAEGYALEVEGKGQIVIAKSSIEALDMQGISANPQDENYPKIEKLELKGTASGSFTSTVPCPPYGIFSFSCHGFTRTDCETMLTTFQLIRR